MEKQIHVNSYVKKDGTQVKEHYRNINGGIVPNDPGDGPWVIKENPRQDGGYKTYFDGGPVLEGSVVFEDIIPLPGGGDVWGTIASVAIGVGATAASVAFEMYKAAQAANFEAISKLKPQLNTAIDNIKTTQVQLENLSNKYLNKLVSTKDQKEYQNLLKSYTQQKAINQKLNNSIAKIDYALENNNYKTVADELKNYQSNFDEVMDKTRKNRPLKNINFSHKNSLKNNKGLTLNRLKFSKNITNGLVSTASLTNLVDDASEFWKASSYDFEQSKEYIEKNGNLVYSVSDLPTNELQQIVTEKLQQQFGKTDTLGVIFKPESSISKAISNSTEFKNFFIENKTKLLNGQIIKKASTRFQPYNNPNLYAALAGTDILYSHIDADGNLYSIIFDTYDFNKDENLLIDELRRIQEYEFSRGYYTLTLIIIPISKWLFWL